MRVIVRASRALAGLRRSFARAGFLLLMASLLFSSAGLVNLREAGRESEGDETSKSEVVEIAKLFQSHSARRAFRLHASLDRPSEGRAALPASRLGAGRSPLIIGHTLPNGLRAPLRS